MSLEWQSKWRNILEHLTLVEEEEVLDEYICEVLRKPSAHIIAFVNAHAMNTVVNNEEFYNSIMSSDTVFRDGSGLSHLLKACQYSPGLNLNGTDLIPKLIQQAEGKVALLGTQEPYLTQAKHYISDGLNPSVELFTADGFQSDEMYIDLVKRNEPNLIVLGMGMPKQERVALQIKEQCSKPCTIICGGAIIDFMGGKVSRAPAWMRKLGIEWLYRLLLEPRRLFMRYVIGNPLFLWRTKKIVRNNDVMD